MSVSKLNLLAVENTRDVWLHLLARYLGMAATFLLKLMCTFLISNDEFVFYSECILRIAVTPLKIFMKVITFLSIICCKFVDNFL